MPPRISVVSVCLNDLHGLRVTWDSLRTQTAPPEEWIVVDGGSSDGTADWLAKVDWQPLNWVSEPDEGIYAGMNKGLARSDADYILFLNSGDSLAGPEVLATVRDTLAGLDPAPALLFGDCFEVDAQGRHHLRRARPARWVPIGMPTSHQAMYFRRDALEEGFDDSLRLSGDYSAVARLFRAGKGIDFARLPVPLCRFVLGGRSDQWRSLFLRENMEVRRQILGMGVPLAWTLHALHYVHGLVKAHANALHRIFRYG